MQDLHPTQRKLLEILKKNIGEPLTIRELQADLNASSPSIIQHHIKKLVEKGFLRRNPSNPSDYQVLNGSPDSYIAYLNVYGMAQCGPNGSILDGNPVDRIRISSKTLGFSASGAFAVKAKGNSMVPKINPGDLVLAKKSSVANDNETVVCVNRGEVLIKKIQKIYQDHGHYTYNLISLNPDFPPFTANDDFRIEGIVKGILSYKI